MNYTPNNVIFTHTTGEDPFDGSPMLVVGVTLRPNDELAYLGISAQVSGNAEDAAKLETLALQNLNSHMERIFMMLLNRGGAEKCRAKN